METKEEVEKHINREENSDTEAKGAGGHSNGKRVKA